MDGAQLAVVIGAICLAIGATVALRAVGRLRDIAALREAYAELAAAKAQAELQAGQLRTTLAGMSDGVMMVDADWRLLQWNDHFSERIGVPHAALKVGAAMADIVRAQALAGEFGQIDDAAAIETLIAERLARLARMGEASVTERTRPNGQVVEIRRAALPGGGFVTLYADITARRQAEAADRAAALAAAEAVRQRQQFVTIVSHELRVPLDAVMSSLTLLADHSLPPQAAALVATARRAGAGLHDLVSDILDLSRLEAGRLVPRLAEFNLPELLGETCQMFGASAAAKSLTIVMILDGDVPQRMHGDEGRIRQVLINLLSNAIKYATKGVITVRGTVAARTLRLTVADPGPAIPPAQAATLFQPFTRLEDAEQGGEKGSGLGLAICARLAEVMGGEIGLGREGEGNAFWLSLPLDFARTADEAATEGALTPLRPASILLVEDVASNRELTAALLRRERHRVDLAENGFAAVALATANLYDLILMDIHMPGIDGVEATRRIRRLPEPAGTVPIVALTGTSTSEDRVGRLDALMDGVLVKPVRPEELGVMLRRHLVRGQHAAPEPPALAAAPAGLLDTARIAGLRDGLAQGMFARLVEQCAADMAERLDALAASVDHARGDHAPGETHGLAHALAGMAGSYGLAGFEGRMRAIMATARRDDVDEVRSLLAGAPAHFAASIAALREVIG